MKAVQFKENGIVYVADVRQAVALIKAGFDVRDPRQLGREYKDRARRASQARLRQLGLSKDAVDPGEGFVYVFGAGAHVKIGMAVRDVYARWDAIRSANPLLERPLYISTALWDNARAIERAAHAALKDHHHSGEWFSCDRALAISTVESLVKESHHG